ncbi:hypothetical protein ESCO_000648 [Escovopsis weberi]|uniref:Uncharacterized protein n=1 Tax=Escovopsis weberi TaxID=150374 RepID=A0A0M8N493_ESCWE|nr:hypothetical protein ESCO_000648 [Escovopsis weberi]
MSWLPALLGGRAADDDGIRSEDDIYPLHFLDHTTVQETIVVWTMRFNDVLDPDMLRASLANVLEQGDWRKLGGRLRKKGSRYQLHVPPSFTEERPALNFSKEIFDMSIEQHPLGCQLPKKTDRPSLLADPDIFVPLHGLPDTPTTFHEYVKKGLPPISVHVAAFSDATLVSFSWIHIVMDAGGVEALLRAWTLSIHARTAEIPALEGAKDDFAQRVRDPIYDEGAEESLLGKSRLSMFASALFAMHFIWDLLFGPKMILRNVFLPKTAVDKLRRQAEDDLGTLVVEHEGDGPGSKGEVRGHISTGDILIAWIVGLMASALPAPRPITALSAVDLRDRLPKSMGAPSSTSSSALVQNLAFPAMTPLTAPQAASFSLGEIALTNRRRFMAQLTSAQAVAGLRLALGVERLGVGGMMVLGESNTLLALFSNWTKNQFCRIVDFSPAVVRTGTPSAARKNPPGTILNHYQTMRNRVHMLRNVVLILGTDHENNYWLNVFLDARTLSRMEESLRKLSKG